MGSPIFELADVDVFLKDDVLLKIQGEGGGPFTRIPFQFPPRITSDVKTANWKEAFQASYEPLAIWMGSEARTIRLEAEYIVSSRFTAQRISILMHAVKAYFYNNAKNIFPKVKLSIYEIVGITGGIATFRAKSVSITYGDGIIQDGAFAFPLYSKFSMELALTTQQRPLGEDDIEQQPAPGLAILPVFDWF